VAWGRRRNLALRHIFSVSEASGLLLMALVTAVRRATRCRCLVRSLSQCPPHGAGLRMERTRQPRRRAQVELGKPWASKFLPRYLHHAMAIAQRVGSSSWSPMRRRSGS